MNEAQALAKMVPPGQLRPGKMGGGGVMQIHLTRACTQACHNCTQGSNLAGKLHFMPVEMVEQALLSLVDYNPSHDRYPFIIALFGGQPTLHPQFPEICALMQKYVTAEKRGLWTNALNGYGRICRQTFLPRSCNLNVHRERADWDEFARDWPEAARSVFGLDCDSRHSPVFVALKDVLRKPDESYDEERAWELIASCDINRDWSAYLGMFRGQLRGWFCEIAGAQSILHQEEPDYPDTGLDPTQLYRHPGPGPLTGKLVQWWALPMTSFAGQVRKHCHECGVPLKGYGALALDPGGVDQVSVTHAGIARPKRKEHQVEVIATPEQLGSTLRSFLDYIGNARRPKEQTVL